MEPIYLDHAATTPLRPEASEAMAPYAAERFGNPSSIHRWGREARAALEEARERLAGLLGAKRQEIIFTSGGTESDNLALLGASRAAGRAGRPGTVVCSAIEHKAVLGAAQAAAREGTLHLLLAVDETGRLELGALDEALAARPAVLSVMWVNNEVGTIQPVQEVAERCRAAGVLFHTDAVQAAGRLRLRMDETRCDLLSLSAHKLGGPKGIGLLYIREGVELLPLAYGGGQERELRPGTQNVAAAVGFAAASAAAEQEREREAARLGELRDRLEAGLARRIPDLVVNGAGALRAPHILNVSIPGADQEALLVGLDLEGLAVSSGSACLSGTVKPSHVLLAMGRGAENEASIRVSLGRTTTAAAIGRVLEVIPAVVERSRALAHQ
ncbi:MAG: cysteine desulfurase [Gemmatimonadetes bacterium]|nr:cysteine desulfurase [Gemmatimonadota bacterium]